MPNYLVPSAIPRTKIPLSMSNSISERIFGADIYSLTYSMLEAFFKIEQAETSILEFKSYHPASNDDKQIVNISESICAFLNSEGGLVIWGAPKEIRKEGAGRKICMGALTALPTLFEKDTIIRKITAKISPLTPNLKFKKIDAEGGGYCYLFEVNRSEFAPHQIDGRYIMRLESTNVPAPHYYIEALMKRISYPKLHGRLSFGKIVIGPQFVVIPCLVFISNFSQYINEKNLHCVVMISQFQMLKEDVLPTNQDFSSGAQIEGAMPILHYGRPYHDRLFILAPRDVLRNNNAEADIMLTFSGDSSPVIHSSYKIKFQAYNAPPYYSYTTRQNSNNESVIDHAEKLGRTDLERNLESSDMILQHFDENVRTFPLIQYIFRR
jgi:hypothetical protein